MHLDDLLGDGEAETGPALGLGIGVVDLMELLEDAFQLLRRYPRARVSHGDGEVRIRGFRGNAHLARVSEFDRIADKVEEGRRLATPVLSERTLVSTSDSVAARTVSTTLSIAYSARFKLN
jgi:hypothetical protein